MEHDVLPRRSTENRAHSENHPVGGSLDDGRNRMEVAAPWGAVADELQATPEREAARMSPHQ